MNKESSISILTNLLNRHEDAAGKYRKAASLATEGWMKYHLLGLADYREGLYRRSREWLEDLPPSPVPVSGRLRSYLHNHWESFREALLRKDQAKVLYDCRICESELSDYYKSALAQKGVPIEIHNGLREQHQRVVDMLKKVERMERVPRQRNNAF